jgi:small subunit ribosomal protein S20
LPGCRRRTRPRAIIAGFAWHHPQTLRNTHGFCQTQEEEPRLASGRKRARQDVKLNAANTSLRSKYRTAVKNVEKAVAAGDKAKATELFAKAQSVVDTVADKGIFHKNKAARDKSRLSAKVKASRPPPPKTQVGSARGPQGSRRLNRVRCQQAKVKNRLRAVFSCGLSCGPPLPARSGAGSVSRDSHVLGRPAGRCPWRS